MHCSALDAFSSHTLYFTRTAPEIKPVRLIYTGAEEIGQPVGHWPCTQLTEVQSLAFQALWRMIPELRTRSKP